MLKIRKKQVANYRKLTDTKYNGDGEHSKKCLKLLSVFIELRSQEMKRIQLLSVSLRAEEGKDFNKLQGNCQIFREFSFMHHYVFILRLFILCISFKF